MVDLLVVVDFLNSIDERTFTRFGTPHSGAEQLSSKAALRSWVSAHALAPESDLDGALRLRTALRRSLLGEASPLERFPLHLEPDASGGLRIAASGALADIVEAVAVAVARGTWSRVKLCAAADCRWAFLDTSRSGAGRWCSMSACGNRSKTRTYRTRRTIEPSRAPSTD